MSDVVGDIRRIPHFISAGTPKELQRRMLLNNVKDGFEYRYFDIQKDGSKWIAWFYRKLEISLPGGLFDKKKVVDG